jgi:hypothetical protein
VAAFDRIAWPLSLGIGGRFPSESVAALTRIPHTDVQTAFAALVLAAFVALLVFWRSLFEYCRSLWKTR